MLSIFLFVLVLSAFPVYASFRLNKTFEETLPVSCMAIILFLFLAGMINILGPGAIIVCACAGLLYIYTVYWIIKNGGLITLKKGLFNLITPGTVVFVIMVILLAFLNKGKYATLTDEFSHWLDTVVIMSQIDDFGTAPNSTAVFPSYPPAMSLFQYLLEKINMTIAGEFSEWKTYFAYHILSVAMMLPFIKTKGMSIWQKIASVVTWPICLITPLYFFANAYTSLYIDPFLGVMAGCGFAAVAITKNKDWLYNTYIIMLCAVLTLAKDVGIYLSIFISLYFLFDYAARSKKTNAITHAEDNVGKVDIKKFVLWLILGLAPMLAMILAKVLWKIELAVSHTEQKFSAPFDIAGTIDTIRGQGSDYYTLVYNNFRDAITNRYIYYERLGFNYSAIMFLITIALILFNVRLYKRGRIAKVSCVAGSIIPSAALIIYILSMFPLYISRFVAEEAINLASFDRYCGIMFLTGLLLLVWLLRDALLDMPNKISLLVLAVLMLCSAYHSQSDNITYFTSRQSVEDAANYRAAVNILSDKINANTSEDSSILLVGTDSDQPFHPILETISKPRSFTFSDVYIPDTVDEMEGAISQDEFLQILAHEYDYVAIYETTENLVQNYSDIFEDTTLINNLTLYTVDKTTGKLFAID